MGRLSNAGGRVLRPTSSGRDVGLLPGKIAAAEQMLCRCAFCERLCRVNRSRGETGACRCGSDSHTYLEGLLWGEEEFITPTYAVFFAGCNLRCDFCYAAEANGCPQSHSVLDPRAVAARVAQSDTSPVSFSFIGGEPTVHLHTALGLVSALPRDLPMVWNSNFYFTEAAAGLLESIMDVYIADLHFGCDDCAREIAGADRYLNVVGRNLKWAAVAGSLVVRHLVLPGHLRCCTAPALQWLARELPGAPVHLMTNFLPPESRQSYGTGRYLAESESLEAQRLALDLGLELVE